MARVAASDVKDIIDTALDEFQIEAFISTANLLVTEKLSGGDLSDAMLTEIEKYLAAHLICLRDQRVQNSSMDGMNLTYQGQTGMRLEATQYGQTVQILDTTGAFASSGLKAVKFSAF